MKNKGFTLIELLAVIVILAIIALIATPVILGIINDTRTEAKRRSAEMVYTGVQYAYTTAMYSNASTGKTVDLKDIKDNLTVDNLATENPTNLDTSSNKLTIKTTDGVICEVTGDESTGFTVKCGSANDDDEYLTSKTFAKKSS